MSFDDRQQVNVSGFQASDESSLDQSDEKCIDQHLNLQAAIGEQEEESKGDESRMSEATVLMQRVSTNFELITKQSKPGEELHIEDFFDKTPENETPRMVKRKYDSSEKPQQDDDHTPKNQAIKLAGSPFDDQSSQESTVRSRKAQKSKLANQLSPVTQPQAIIGEGLLSNNDESIIGEGLASANTYCDDLARADFMGTVKTIQFNEESEFQAMANSMPLPDPSQ